MNRQRILSCWTFCLALVGGWPLLANAAPPWGEILTFKRVEADPHKSYRVTEGNGPWMIMACSFAGENAEQQANQLVYELRRRYKLKAYMHRMKFEFGHTRGRGLDAFGAPVKMRHRVNDLEEVAVLVGDFRAVDDPQAQRTLQKVKLSRPRCMDPDAANQNARSLAGWRDFFQKRVLASGSKHKAKGPLGHAFVTTNPVLPPEFYNTPGLDPLVLEMNEHVPHSLLDCPRRFTVQVATRKGSTVINQEEIQAIEGGKKVKSKLANAAREAHELTEALRMKGWEAYEFHDRHASIVTVGSFDSVGVPQPGGWIEINPRIHTIIETFKAQPTRLPGQTPGAMAVKSLIGVPFDIQPRIVHAPKRSISRSLARGQSY